MSKPNIAELERLEQEALQAPWIAVPKFDGSNWLVVFHAGYSGIDNKDWTVTTYGLHASEADGDAKTDTQFIAAARNAMPALLAVAKAAMRLREVCDVFGGNEYAVSPAVEELDAALDHLDFEEKP